MNNIKKILENTIQRFRERKIILPTFAQMRNPGLIPDRIKQQLKSIGLWDLNPFNLFRITWKNEPTPVGGGFGKVNYLEIPSSLTGIKARVVFLVGKWFPTGAHKVGAAYGCLAPRIITGQFDPTIHKAVWPSTGNYCRGGAFDSYLMGCTAVAILPEEMSRERFEWLREVDAEIFATPGCESNVKEIYDKCWELRRTKPDYIILNQFDEPGNPVWHYHVTGPALEETFDEVKEVSSHLAAFISNTGSAGTIAGGDYLRTKHPLLKVVASEALQCPTLLNNGFGGHRIEGIGDKHVPWVHNVRNTDVVTAIDDEDCMRLLRLFNEPVGKDYLKSQGIDPQVVDQLHLLGISGIANLISAIKTAKHFEYTGDDIILTIATDSVELYQSRLEELREERGDYTTLQAARDFEKCLLGAHTSDMKELGYPDRKAIHNLKYFTWVEQQGKTVQELNDQWYDPDYWSSRFAMADEWDTLIEQFNERTGVIKEYL
ncbi:MAG: pyridoxal-phosphate dependent enzyme [Bacteroidales bacterium]|nr:pyridoxal-phosphate dependent enzyme [Bacteroidales bacterium]MDZ4203862.1 pyridoxal-phosphate dependent enzyme [Bacteroidales bacterium]